MGQPMRTNSYILLWILCPSSCICPFLRFTLIHFPWQSKTSFNRAWQFSHDSLHAYAAGPPHTDLRRQLAPLHVPLCSACRSQDLLGVSAGRKRLLIGTGTSGQVRSSGGVSFQPIRSMAKFSCFSPCPSHGTAFLIRGGCTPLQASHQVYTVWHYMIRGS